MTIGEKGTKLRIVAICINGLGLHFAASKLEESSRDGREGKRIRCSFE